MIEPLGLRSTDMYGKWTKRHRGSALAVAFGLLLVACGGGDDGGGGSTDEASDTTEAAEASLTEAGAALDVVFDDDLVDDENGWGESETEEFTTAFGDDGYEVAIVGGEDAFWSYPDGGPRELEDTSTTVEVDEIAGTAPRSFGTACRLTETGPIGYYSLTIDNDTGGYAIARWTQGEDDPEILAEGEDEVIEDVGEDEPVEVTGTCLGEGDGEPVDLALAVNGEEVATATDEDGLPAGLTGLTVARFDGADGSQPVTFTGIEIRGDEDDSNDTIVLEDDFSDSESGFSELDEDEFGNLTAYQDGGFVMNMGGTLTSPLPIRGPLPDLGTVTADLTGDFADGYVGFCLEGPTGQYEFAVSADGYASLGFYPVDGSDFVLIDEATDAYTNDGTISVTAGWNTDGSSTNLDIYVDDEVIASAQGDDNVTAFSRLYLCGTVSQDAPEGASMPVIFDDLVLNAG